jgi:hypothetical protein
MFLTSDLIKMIETLDKKTWLQSYLFSKDRSFLLVED